MSDRGWEEAPGRMDTVGGAYRLRDDGSIIHNPLPVKLRGTQLYVDELNGTLHPVDNPDWTNPFFCGRWKVGIYSPETVGEASGRRDPFTLPLYLQVPD